MVPETEAVGARNDEDIMHDDPKDADKCHGVSVSGCTDHRFKDDSKDAFARFG